MHRCVCLIVLSQGLVYSYLAEPALIEEYPEKVIAWNEEIIHHHSQLCLRVPLTSVERTYRGLIELISPHRVDAAVTIVPMGPKPQVLGGVLACLRLEDVCCLRVSSTREGVEDVPALGPVIRTRVEFRRD